MPGLKRQQYRYKLKETDKGEDYEETEQEKADLKKRREPISLEELIKKRKEAESLGARPKFLSKADRQAAAIARRKAQVEELKSETDSLAVKRKRMTLDGQKQLVESLRNANQASQFTDTSRTKIKDITGKPNAWVSSAEQEERKKKIELAEQLAKVETSRADEALKMLSTDELDAIKEGYLGRTKQAKQRTEMMKKRKNRSDPAFSFDWDASDDTSNQNDANPLYSEPHQLSLFGRGSMGGMDKSLKIDANDFYKEKNDRFRFFCDGLRRYNKEQLIEIMDEPDEISRGVNKRRNHDLEGKWDMRAWHEKDLTEMTERDWRILREDYAIATKGGNIPRPLRAWSESALKPEIIELLAEIGYDQPTPIQRQAIPISLQNRDVIGIAETGSGKTAAFLLPLVQWLSGLDAAKRNEGWDEGPFAIIMAPTRELAMQICEESDKFGKKFDITSITVIGGQDKGDQGFRLQQGVDIVVGTPGRLLDMLESRYLALSRCTYVVLDEADRMIDMGFEEDVMKILDFMPVTNEKPAEGSEEADNLENPEWMVQNFGSMRKYRQTVMFTATMPAAVERLARGFMRMPGTITIGTSNKPTDRVVQEVHLLNHEEHKKNKLLSVLQQGFVPPIMIFVNSKKGADLLSKNLCKIGYSATTLHGGKNQEQREYALASLKDGRREILVATDIAGRGIDIKDVSLVINFDMAKTVEMYIHRIGRTGRAGKTGHSVTFLTGQDAHCFYEMKQLLIDSPISKCPSELDKHPEAQQKMTMKDMGHFWAAKQNEKEYSRR